MLVNSQSGVQSLEECVHRCEEEKYKTCKEMAYNAETKVCNLYKAVTFDERCMRKAEQTGWKMYTRAGYRFPDETLSKCTHRDLFNEDYDVTVHCNSIKTAKECTNNDVHIKLLKENTQCDQVDTERIKVYSDRVYTKEECNSFCTGTKGCVQFNIGQEAPYLGNCDLYKSHFCTFENKE
jgi:hypothetical protein